MEGCDDRAANENTDMDSKGAQELARLFIERHGAVPEAAPVAPLQNANAAPIFHWVGVEPPASSGSDPADPEAA
jgi:hypothetical protein